MKHLKLIFLLLGFIGFRTEAQSIHKAQLETVQLQFQNKQYGDVVKSLSRYADRLNAEGFLLLAAAYSELGQFDSELRILNQISTKDPKNHQWTMLIAQSHLKKAMGLKNEDEKKKEETLAVASLRKTLKLNSKFKPAFDALLQIFVDKKENHEARELLMDGVRWYGAQPKLLNDICQLQAQDGFLEAAVENCSLAVKASPNYPDNYVYLAQAYLDQEQNDKAQQTMKLAGQKFPNSEFAQWAAGKVYLIVKNYEAAAKYFYRATRVEPKSKRALEGLAESLFQSGNPEDAYVQFQAACRNGAKKSEELHVKAAELRMKSKEILGTKYRGLAENCL